jgi:hypothetical protein
MKPKINRKGDPKKKANFDDCLTPPYGTRFILPFIPLDWTIWEPAAGRGVMVDAMRQAGRTVIGSTIENGENFFIWTPPALLYKWNVIVTNPPYSIKYDWLERCYALNKPFALLMPVEMIGTAKAQKTLKKFPVEIVYMDKRIDFIMPYKGLDGHGAQFPVCWYTYGLHIGSSITFIELDKPDKEDVRAWWTEWDRTHP